MIAGLRLFAIGFIVLSVVYLYLSLRQRWRCRRALEDEYDQGHIKGDRDAFIEAGLKEYQGSLRRKLIWGVYIVPLVLVALLIYVTNFL